jgi:hypothetical protein
MNRTHRISLFETVESHSGEDAWGHPDASAFSGAAVAENVECNLQPLTGSVRQAAAGREIDATWQGFVPSDVAVREDMGVLVTAVNVNGQWSDPPVSHPRTFRVKQVGWHGGKWDTDVMLGTTREQIPAEAES